MHTPETTRDTARRNAAATKKKSMNEYRPAGRFNDRPDLKYFPGDCLVVVYRRREPEPEAAR